MILNGNRLTKSNNKQKVSVMERFLHCRIHVDSGQSVRVNLNTAARIYLLDDKNYQRLRAHKRFRYLGRSQPRDNVVIRPDSPGTWHVVISGANSSSLSAEVSLLS
jgi:hypothetical protein